VIERRTWVWTCDVCGLVAHAYGPHLMYPAGWKLVGAHGYGREWIPERAYCPDCAYVKVHD
jgi:rubredoxin